MVGFFTRRKDMGRLFGKVLLCAVSLAILLMGPLSSGAQVVWTTLGPYGGQIYDIAVDADDPDKMFAGSYLGDGLFVTTDGGSTWQAVEASNDPPGEGTFKNHAVWAIKIAPSDNSVVWAAHNYWVEKSTDGGKTWTHIWNGAMQRDCTYSDGTACPSWDQYRWCRSLAIDPSDPQTVYVGTGGRYTNYEPCGAIYRTEDGGGTWTKMSGPEGSCWPGSGNFDYEVVDMAIDASDLNVLVIWAVTSNGGVFEEEAGPGDKVADGTLYRGEIDRLTGAETWTEVFSMDGGEMYDVEIYDPDTVFTANDWGIFRHYYEGGAWKYQWILNLSGEPPLPGEVFARNVRALAFDPNDPDRRTLYAAWKNSHSKWDNVDTRSKVARYVAPPAGAPTWEDDDWEIYTVDYQFLTLAVHEGNSEVVFGGELQRGVYRSSNHGQTWASVNNGINALLVYDVEANPNDPNHLLAATATGVHEKQGAADWINTSRFEYTIATCVAFDPAAPGGSTYYAGTQNYLAKTTNHGTAWTLSDELQNDFVTDIAIGPGGDDLYITTEKAGGSAGTAGVYRSRDGLATPTLTRILSSDEFAFNVVLIDPNNPDRVFAGSGNYARTKVLGNLYVSADGGDTWQLTGLSRAIVNDLLIDPRDSRIMYAGCGYSGGTDAPVYKSTDGGITWIPSFYGIPGGGFSKLAVWGTSVSHVFVGGDGGSTLYYDGSTFTPMRSGTTKSIYNFWGSSGADIWGVGADGLILHYDGTVWETMDSKTTEYLRGVWGSSGTNVYAVGNSATVRRYDGNEWNEVDISGLTAAHLRSVWGSSGNDVFVSGYSGTILRYDGAKWTVMDSGTAEMILGLWGTSSNNVFAVGGNGTILHYDGNANNTWSSMASPTAQELQAVWGVSEADIFAVGAGGAIVHYNGNTWTTMNSGITSYIWRVWGASETEVFAVGDGGYILYYDGVAWQNIAPTGEPWNSVTDMQFHPQNKNIIYAGTDQQGVYISPNQGRKWLNLGTPEYAVKAISTSSLYAGTQAGVLQCTGTGVIAGQLSDAVTQAPVDKATVFNDMGVKTISVNGEYMMVTPVGIFSVTAVKDGYANRSLGNVTVYGGDVSWADMGMELGVSDPTVFGMSGGGDIGGGG
jgi:hypothetical protein